MAAPEQNTSDALLFMKAKHKSSIEVGSKAINIT